VVASGFNSECQKASKSSRCNSYINNGKKTTHFSDYPAEASFEIFVIESQKIRIGTEINAGLHNYL
jgi:hypothetical protein